MTKGRHIKRGKPLDADCKTANDENNNILKQQTFCYEDFQGWAELKDRINDITLGVPKYKEDFYVIKNEKDLKDVQALIKIELEEELKKENSEKDFLENKEAKR